MEDTKDLLANGKISKLLLKYSLPCIISLLVGALYNIVDQIFIANASYLGSNGNAANTVVFPMTAIALGLSVCIGDGCCSMVSGLLGKGNQDKARRAFGNTIIISIIAGLFLFSLYLIFGEKLVILFGGKVNDDTFRFAKEYMFYITLGIPFYMFSQSMNPVIRADGNPRYAMITTVCGAIINTILDPIFIFVFKWGMKGAAIATVIGQVVSSIFAIVYLFNLKSVKLDRYSFKLKGKIIGRIFSLGITSLLVQVSIVTSMAAVNNMLKKYGALDPIYSIEEYSQIPMAVIGIVMKFYQIIISIIIGLAVGLIPVLGFNMGAKNYNRVAKLYKTLLALEIIIGTIGLFVVEIFPRSLIKVFGSDNESIYYTNFAIKAFRIYLSMLIIACVNKCTCVFLQSIGKAFLSTCLSMTREIILGVSLTLTLPIFFGVDGVLYSMPLAELIISIATIAVIITILSQLKNNKIKSAI